MEHDDRCNMQDRELTELKMQYQNLCHWMKEVTDRVQLLVVQMHEQNAAQGVMSANLAHVREKVDDIDAAVEKLGDAIPKLTSKEDHHLLRNIVFGIIGAFGLGFISAVVAWIAKGGMAK